MVGTFGKCSLCGEADYPRGDDYPHASVCGVCNNLFCEKNNHIYQCSSCKIWFCGAHILLTGNVYLPHICKDCYPEYEDELNN